MSRSIRNRHAGYRAKEEPICVIIMECDVDDPFRSHGAIIMEQYPSDSPEQVMERGKALADGGKYGRVWTGTVRDITLVPPTPLEDNNDNAKPLEGAEA
jgi:hypothetical protein